MGQRESSFKVVRYVLGAIGDVMPRLRTSLTGIFFGTPSDHAADAQGNVGGVPGGGVAWAVDPDTHGGASFIVCDSFPAEYIEDEKKIYMLDSLGKRHAGARPLIVGKNVELATNVIGDQQGTVSRGAEFGDAKRGGHKFGNNVFYPAAGSLIAHHLQPDPPEKSSLVYDVDGRKAGIHGQWRVVRFVKAFCQGATGVAESIFAVALNFSRNGDGTAAHGLASFKDGRSLAALSKEAGGPLTPADDRNHVLGETPDALIHQGANDIDVLYGPIRKLYGPEELVDEQWESGGKGPFIKRVEKRPDFEAKHTNACGKPASMVIKWQTWSDFNTYPTYPRFPEEPPPKDPEFPPPDTPEYPPPRDVFPKPDPVPVKDRLPRPEYGNAPPVTSTPNEIGVPSEYGEPVPGTPEPRVPVPPGISRFMVGHNFTEEERVRQGRVGHSVYAPVYKSNTAGAGDTAAKRWPVAYTSEGKLYMAANGRVLAIERPYYASGAKITLAPEMERQHQFVANKEAWPTTLSAFYTIFGAGKNAAGTELVGGFGMGLRVPSTYLPASGVYMKLDFTDSTTLPDVDIRTTDENGLDASTGRKLMFNGTELASSGTAVTAASAFDAANKFLIRSTAAADRSVDDSGVILDDSNNLSGIGTLASGAHTMAEQAAPSTPPTGHVVIYPKSDGLMYSKDDAGAETALGGGGGSSVRTVSAQFGGPGGSISASDTVWVRVPYTGTITKVSLLADATGSIVVDVWKDTYANYPPTVADTIAAAAKPTLSSANKSEDSTLTGWTTAVTAGDVLKFNVDSVSGLTQVSLLLEITV